MIPYKVKIKLNYWHLVALRESFVALDWPKWPVGSGCVIERDRYRYLLMRDFGHLVAKKLAGEWAEPKKDRLINLTPGQLLAVHAVLTQYCMYDDPELIFDFREALSRIDKAKVNIKKHLHYAD